MGVSTEDRKVEFSRVIIPAILDVSFHNLECSVSEQTGTQYSVHAFDSGRVYRFYKWLVVMKVPVRLTSVYSASIFLLDI